MQQRVTAILVVRSGVEYLERTLSSLQSQTRPPDSVIAVDAGSTDGSRELLASYDAAKLLSAPAGSTFGRAAAIAIDASSPVRDPALVHSSASPSGSGPATSAQSGDLAAAVDGSPANGSPQVVAAEVAEADDEWLWLLGHDNAPAPEALAQLLHAVEIAPSVAVAGPKLMQWLHPDVIAEFGESMTRLGASMALVDGELDQAQHDVQNDVLGVASGGMLVRRSVWTALGGFDHGLPSTDAGLDFSVRARLAGHRVIVVPGARVASAGGPQHFGLRSVSETRRLRIARSAQLHRRLVYSPVVMLPVHWLTLVPLAVLRSLRHLVAKRPGSVPAELAAAFAVAFGRTSVMAARRSLARTRRVSWNAIAPLRLTRRQVAEYRLRHQGFEDGRMARAYRPEPIGYVTGGGLWATAVAAAIGLVAFGGLVGAEAVVGGGLLPLPDGADALWQQVGYGWRDIGPGFLGAADPFSAVLAVLGSLTFWHPSTAVVVLYVCALPLAATIAWFCARSFTDQPWAPGLAAVLWSIAPPFLSSLHTGRLGAVIAHILLPALVLLTIRGARSWTAAGGAALLFAAVTASAPVLIPALVLLLVVWIASRTSSALRLALLPLPAAALFAPLVWEQVSRGYALGLLADPGLPVGRESGAVTTSGVQLALGSSNGDSNGWGELLDRLALPGAAAPVIVIALLLPIGVLSVMALFVRGSRRAIPALAIALIGFATAVAASRLDLSFVGNDPVTVWPGSGLSLFWLGLLGGVVVALDALGRAALGSAVLAGVASGLVVIPLVAAGLLGTTGVHPGSGRVLPAIVDAEAAVEGEIGTLVLVPEREDAITVDLERGPGAVLTDQSTLDATSPGFADPDDRLAALAGNLASRSGYDFAAGLDALGIGYIVLMEPREDAAPVFARTAEALDANPLLVPVGQTPTGLLWSYADGSGAQAPTGPGNLGTPVGIAVLAGQATVIALTALLAIPTTVRRRRYTQRGSGGSAPTFSAVVGG